MFLARQRRYVGLKPAALTEAVSTYVQWRRGLQWHRHPINPGGQDSIGWIQEVAKDLLYCAHHRRTAVGCSGAAQLVGREVVAAHVKRARGAGRLP